VPAQQFAVAIRERVTNQREPVADERQPLPDAEHVYRPEPESLGRADAVCHPVRFGEPEREPQSEPVRDR
jgi:hypothetical protein